MNTSEFRKAFTVVELLVVTVILLLLAGMTLGSLRGMRDHQILEQHADSFSRMLAYGQAEALAGGDPVYLAVTVPPSDPASASYRAYTLIRVRGGPELLKDWQLLPRGVFFAPDPVPDPDRVDLLDAPVFDRLTVSPDLFPAHVPFSGEVALWVMMMPDGGFYTLQDEHSLVPALQNAGIVLQTGTWFRDTTGEDSFAAEEPVDAVRIRLRPRTGRTRVERILP